MEKTKKLLLCTVLGMVVSLVCAFVSACGFVNTSVKYTLYFRVDGEVYASISTTGNEVIELPDDPQKEGYTFDGWYWDNHEWNQPFTAKSLLDAPLSGNMSVFAKMTDSAEPAVTTLATPTITKIEYDTVYWEAVDHAESYVVRVNDNYECTLRGTSCSLADVKWDGKAISNYGEVSVKVMAKENGNYAQSEWLEVDSSYYYVPAVVSSTVDTLVKFSIGFGYNVIEDDYLDITQSSKKSVFNVGKLLTIGQYTARPNSTGSGSAYQYSTIDEFVSKTRGSFEYGLTAGCVLLGKVKMQLNTDIGFDYKTYEYNNTFVYEYNITYKDHIITNFSDDNLLVYCLSDDFLKEIRRESASTVNMTDDQLAEYLYQTYGTHAILGITTGGSYFANYTISTNKRDIATDIKAGFSLSTSGGGAIDQIVQKDFNLSASVEEEINQNSESTKAAFTTHYYGGSGAATSTPSGVDSALKTWSASLSEDNARSIKFTKDGAISIVTLLSYLDNTLAAKLDRYIDTKADETYRELFQMYSKSVTLPMEMQTADGINTLVVDLSQFQEVGNLNNVAYPSFADNVLTVYSTMFAKEVDVIKIAGAYHTDQTPIASFSVKLSEEWEKDVYVVLENAGVYTANEKGLIDVSAIRKKIKVTVDYIGENVVIARDGTDLQAAQSAFVAEDLEFVITSSDSTASLKIYGGNGQDGVIAGSSGQDGADAIIVGVLTVNTTGELYVRGGNGGNGVDGTNGSNGLDSANSNQNGGTGYNGEGGIAGGVGGAGGSAVSAYTIVINANSAALTLIGGDGGAGGNGGSGGNGGKGMPLGTDANTGDSKKGGNGGNGGDGGAGGNGGVAALSQSFTINSGTVVLTGGNGGTGGAGGNGGDGGTGSRNSWWFAKGGSGGAGGNGGTGGNGGLEGEGCSVTITENGGNAAQNSGTKGDGGNGGAGGAGGNGGTGSGSNGSQGTAGNPGENGN